MIRSKAKCSTNGWSLKAVSTGVAALLSLCMISTAAWAIEFDVKGTSVNLGGSLKLSGVYDLDGNVNDSIPNGLGDEVSAYAVPLDGTAYADENRFSMSARESRLFLKTRTETESGIITTHIEGDFNCDDDYSSDTWSSSRQFRLRHAYGSWTSGSNSIIAGQTWTTFMDFAGAVPTMDFAGDPGQPFIRQPQIRLTHDFSKGHYISLAAENSDRGFTRGGTLFQHIEDNHTETMPDFILKYFWGVKNFHLSPKLLARRFELDGQSTLAWAANLTSHLGFGNGHRVMLGLTYGDGIGRYAGLGLNAGAGISDEGEAETVEYMSINTGVVFSLMDNVQWIVGCGYSENDEDAYEEGILSGIANKNAFSWHTMVTWKIKPAIEVAFGYQDMQQEVMDGREGDMQKIQSYVKFDF